MKNRILILTVIFGCSALLNINSPISITAQLPAAERQHTSADTHHKKWSCVRLENFINKRMISRSEWAKLPRNNNPENGFYNTRRKPVRFIGIHHDGSRNATLNSILKYHIKRKGWGDIAYHFIIDRKGRIYEGRSLDRTSDTHNVFESYGEERLSGMVNILLLGNYDREKIKAESPQIRSAKLLVSYLYLKYPLVTLNSIRGHSDFISDSESGKRDITCPGKNMYTPVNIVDEIKHFVSQVSKSNKINKE